MTRRSPEGAFSARDTLPRSHRDELRYALAVAGFIDPDDGTVPMWPHGDRFPRGPVWVSAWQLVDTILANLPDDVRPAPDGPDA